MSIPQNYTNYLSTNLSSLSLIILTTIVFLIPPIGIRGELIYGFTLISIGLALFSRTKIPVSSFVPLFITILLAIINLQYTFLLTSLIIFYAGLLINNKQLHIPISFIFTLSIVACMQIVITELFNTDGRVGFYNDPNFTALKIMYFIMINIGIAYSNISQIYKGYLLTFSIILFYFTLLLTVSRMLALMGLIVFVIYVSNLQKIFVVKNILKYIRLRPYFSYLFINFCFLFISQIVLDYIGFEFGLGGSDNIIDRMTNVNDQSVFGRLTANVFWISEIFSSEYILSGLHSEEILIEEYPLLPHNSVLYSIAMESWAYFFACSYFAVWMISKLNNDLFYIVYFPFLLAGIVLHGSLSPFYLMCIVLVVIIINTINKNKKNI